MKNYWKYFLIPYTILGIICIVFVLVGIIQYIPEGNWNMGNSNIHLYIFAGAVGLASVVTVAYIFITRPKADTRTTTEKTFLGCGIMKESRDVLIKKSLIDTILGDK